MNLVNMEKRIEKSDLIPFLDKKLAMLNQYLSVSKQMSKNLANLGVKELRHLLSERNQCIKKIKNIDLIIKDVMQMIRRDRSSIHQKIDNVIDRHLQDIKEIANIIIPLDKELMANVTAERDDLKNRLLKIQHARKAVKRYGEKTALSSRFLNTTN